MIIVYCDACGLRIPEGDFESGAATRVDEYHARCTQCSPKRKSGPAKRPATGKLPGSGEIAAARAAAAARTTSTRITPARSTSARSTPKSGSMVPATRSSTATDHRRTGRSESPSSNKAMIFGGVAVTVVFVVLAVVLGSGGGETKRPVAGGSDSGRSGSADKPKSSSGPKLPDPGGTGNSSAQGGTSSMEAMRNQLAAGKLEELKAFRQKYPLNRIGYREKLDEMIASYRTTPAGKEALALLEELKAPGEDEPLADESSWVLAVDLLSMIDVQRDSVNGEWSMDGGRLVIEPKGMARLQIPYRPPEEYDFRVTFVRSEGEEDVNQFLTHDGSDFFWSMGCEKNKAFGFDMVDNTNAYKNRTAVSVNNALENGQEYVSIVQVRKAFLKAWLNGKLIRYLPTNYRDLSMRNDWKLKTSGVLGVGAHNSRARFIRMQVREVTGKGERL